MTLSWCGASNIVYQIQTTSELGSPAVWEPQELLIGEGIVQWQDTNAPLFWPARFYRCRALPGDEDADADGLSNMEEYALGTNVDATDRHGCGRAFGCR
jgi:hypothetical protein